MFQKLTIIILSLLIAVSCGSVYGQNQENESPVLTREQKEKIIEAISVDLNKEYIFAETAAEMEKFMKKKLHKGTYDDLASREDFTNELTKDLQSISKDRHLGVMVLPPRDPEQKQADTCLREEKLRRDNYGFKKLEILPGNIGYVDLRMFAGAATAGSTAIAAMNFLAGTEAIIFDLRNNGGGDPSMIQLISSYFFDEPTHLNDFYIRRDNSTQQFWTQAQVIGPRMTDKVIYILTSNFTFSGAEEFTYNLKNLERATIVGETTGGGAHPVDFRPYEELGIMLKLPFGRAVNPITGTNWEGTGVEPHIKVPAQMALTVAQKEIMTKLLEKEKDVQKQAELRFSLRLLEAQANPIVLEPETMKDFVGVYGPRTISLEDGVLYYQRQGMPRLKMVPLGEDYFQLEAINYFMMQFKRNASGKVDELVGLYDNGKVEPHKRKD